MKQSCTGRAEQILLTKSFKTFWARRARGSFAGRLGRRGRAGAEEAGEAAAKRPSDFSATRVKRTAQVPTKRAVLLRGPRRLLAFYGSRRLPIMELDIETLQLLDDLWQSKIMP